MSRTRQQLAFLLTSDRLKSVTRQNSIFSGERAENVAEHSWHLTLMVLLFAAHAPPGTDPCRVLSLLVVHDLVEIYAGDELVLTEADAAVVAEREAEAAERLFGMLPEDQRESFNSLWQEFEDQVTPEARFARAIDALHPSLMTWGAGGRGLSQHTHTAERTVARKRDALEPYPALWGLLQDVLRGAVAEGILTP